MEYKVGDKILIDGIYGLITEGKPYEIVKIDIDDNNQPVRVIDDRGYGCWPEVGTFRPYTDPETPKLWREMTDAEKGALLLAKYEGKVIEKYSSMDKEWVSYGLTFFFDSLAFRVKPETKRETCTANWDIVNGFHDGGWTTGTHIITFETIDGEPDCASIKMERVK